MSKFIPNSFQIPNAFVDEMMRDLSGGAVKCYLLVARQTTGWHRESDSISIAKFQEFTGVKDKRTIFGVLDELEIYGLIRTKKSNGEITEFFLEISRFTSDENNATSSKKCTQLQKMQPVTKNATAPVAKNAPATSSKKCTSTKNNINTKNKNNNSGVRAFCKTHGVTDDLTRDFLQYRKSIKAPLTINAVIGLDREARKAGMSLGEVFELLMVRGWRGFNAGWVSAKTESNSGLPPVDYSAVVAAYNEILGDRLVPMDELDALAEKQIHTLLPHLKDQSVDGFSAYFHAFADNAKPFYFEPERRFGFSFLMKPETLVKTRRGEL